MHAHVHHQNVPKGALWGALALIVLTIALAAASRRSGHVETQASAPAIQVVYLRFEDRPDGTLAILDADTGRELRLVAPGTNGFTRGVVRGMFRNRKLESMGPDARFRLAREANGRLTLEDPESGRRVDVASFGPTNEAAFAELLVAARVATGGPSVQAGEEKH